MTLPTWLGWSPLSSAADEVQAVIASASTDITMMPARVAHRAGTAMESPSIGLPAGLHLLFALTCCVAVHQMTHRQTSVPSLLDQNPEVLIDSAG
jgi:hypothetical protein